MYDVFANLLDAVVFVLRTALQVMFVPPLAIIAHIEEWVTRDATLAAVEKNYKRLRNGILVALLGCIIIPIVGLSLAVLAGNHTTAAQVITWLTCMGLALCIIILAIAAAPFPIVYTVLADVLTNTGAGLANLKAFFRGGSHTDYPQLAQTLAMAKNIRKWTCLVVGLVMVFFIGVLLSGMFATPKYLGLAILAALTLGFLAVGFEMSMGPLVKGGLKFSVGLLLIGLFVLSALYFWGVLDPKTGKPPKSVVSTEASNADEEAEGDATDGSDDEDATAVEPASSKKSGKAAPASSKPKVKKPEPTVGELAEQARQSTRKRLTVSVLNLTPYSLHAIVSYDPCRGKDTTKEEILVPKRGFEGIFEQIVPCDQPLFMSVYRVAPDGSDDMTKRWEYSLHTEDRRFENNGEPYNSGRLETTANGTLRFAVLDNEYDSHGRPLEVAAVGATSPRLNKPRVYDPTTRSWR